jgi:hypothetical protein
MAAANTAPAAWTSYFQTVAAGVTVILMAWVCHTVDQVHTDVAVLTVRVEQHGGAINDLQSAMRRLAIAP